MTFAVLPLLALASCNLDLLPITSFHEGNVQVEEDDPDMPYTTRQDMEGLRNSIYNSWAKAIQECGFEDFLIYSECRADNAYCGTNTAAIMYLESNRQDAVNPNVTRDWNWYLGQAQNANNIICYIDDVFELDTEWTNTSERDGWKAEAMCWRAWNWLRLAQLFGTFPMVTTIPEKITAENIERVYSQYYPARNGIDEIREQLVADMEYAIQYAPDPDPSDKFVFSKAFAHGILARFFAENTPARDWSKVEEHCRAIEAMGYELEPSYGNLWGYDEDDAVRNTRESIFEVQWTNKSSGNWVFMMFHRNAYNPMSSYTWAKWVTPSRDIIAAYDAAGDAERKNASIIIDECTWTNYYPANEYAFMHKVPTNVSSIILMRLAEIYLLHAEALAGQGHLGEATGYVNRVRRRAGLRDLPAPASYEECVDMILDERRLELAFEGFRFFDLARYGWEKVKAVHDAMPASDPYWQARNPFAQTDVLLPVPQTQLDVNPNLDQNPGY